MFLFAGNCVGVEGCRMVCETIMQNSTLKRLYLSGKLNKLWVYLKLDDVSCAELDNWIGEEGAKRLSDVSRMNASVDIQFLRSEF